MANSIDFLLTNAADELVSKVLSGKTLNFTRMAVGDGFSYDINVTKGFTTLVNEVLSLDITKKETLSPSSVRITSAFKNTDAQKEFYYREVGLYAQDPDTGEEVLYAYGNRNDAAELITPAGSNIVTKQLIFIISVGDSANVTFNVNADVYALQEDMLDVQSNKADKNLANTGMITNCLLEIPQRIKYELSPEGALTIKAGSVVIVPYGVEDLTVTYPIGSTFLNENFKVVDNQYKDGKFFVWVEMQNNTTITSSGSTDSHKSMLFFDLNVGNLTLTHIDNGQIYTETTPTLAGGNIWHDMTNNKLLRSSYGSAWDTILSFPLGILTVGNNSIIALDQVFNGMGYIGSIVWIDKGVKGLIPNGRNADGTFKNIEHTVSKVIVEDFLEENHTGSAWYVVGDNDTLVNSGQGFYVSDDGYLVDKWSGIITRAFVFADGERANGVVTSFNPYRPFQAVDKVSDKSWLSKLGMPSERYIEYEIGPNDSTYVAPANGYFTVRCTSTNIGYFILYNNTTGMNEERQPAYAGAAVTPRLEVRKGDIVQIVYNLVLDGQKIFRFYYADGEVN